MIIGNGDIASQIDDREDIIFFASGVSNSRETREAEYRREIDLLVSQDTEKHLVYFSSLCVFYSDSRYATHKRHVEKLVKGFKTWTIIRLGNITWGTNPHTLINFLKNQKKRGESMRIDDVYRFVVTPEEFKFWLSMIPKWGCEINIPGQRMKVREIVDKYVLCSQ